jgi:hypothetical protein
MSRSSSVVSGRARRVRRGGGAGGGGCSEELAERKHKASWGGDTVCLHSQKSLHIVILYNKYSMATSSQKTNSLYIMSLYNKNTSALGTDV